MFTGFFDAAKVFTSVLDRLKRYGIRKTAAYYEQNGTCESTPTLALRFFLHRLLDCRYQAQRNTDIGRLLPRARR